MTKVQGTIMLGAAHEVIKPKDQATIVWAEFDSAWYLRRYPDVRLVVDDADPDAVLQFYLISGQQIGHSPNPWFDEAWYLQQYPDVAAAVRDGAFASGFDEYCRVAYGGRSPHWLYEDYLYRISGEELTDEVLLAGGFVNRYDHYLRRGSREGRTAHLLFDAAYYLSVLNEQEAQEARDLGAFQHFLPRIAARQPAPRTSVYFDPDWYRHRYPVVAARFGTTWLCALHHYLTNVTPTEFDPLPEFSEPAYLETYPDIAATVAQGSNRNGYQHFLSNGVFELRSPCDSIDLKYYVNEHESVRVDLEAGRARDAFAHLLSTGRAQGLTGAPVAEGTEEEIRAKALFLTKAENMLPIIARHPLDFGHTEPPALSVIMVLHNNFALSMMALSSLRSNYPGDIELILVDSGSSDETRFISRYIRGADVIRIDSNIGFVKACNAALMSVTAQSVLYLNNDVELAPGAVDSALRRLNSDPRIGAVGAKIIRLHGKLQEAGSIIWRDGITRGYMRDASPLAPEANFVRDVDFSSAAFLMVRTEVLQRLEGFAEGFTPAYYEDADLCARIIQEGMRVVYDPSVVIHHYEYGTAVNQRAVKRQIGRGRQTFINRNAAFLRDHYIADPRVEVFARSRDMRQRRILFIEDQVPLRFLGSGFVRSNDLIRVMAALGFHVTVFPIFGGRFDIASIYSDMPDTVEVMFDRSLEDLPEFLNARDGYYDTFWVVRTHNLDRTHAALEGYLLGKGRPPRIILDTEAIGALREEARNSLNPSAKPFDLNAAIAREFSNAAFSQSIVTVCDHEARTLRGMGFNDVSVIGHARDVDPTMRPFAERSGMLFVGAIHDMNSPNHDSLCWFVDEVLPLVERELRWETRLTIAGYTASQVTLDRFRDHHRISIVGPVADTRPLYDTNRVFIAPTRFAAGTPYKIHEAASFGLPVVATELLRGQLGWENGRDMLSADTSDPALFASHIVRLHREPALWQGIRDAAIERLRTENNLDDYSRLVQKLLGPSHAG
jgi:GT2 family glycosyltransferase